MHGMLKRAGLSALHRLDSPEAGAVLAEQGLSRSRSRPRPRRAGADARAPRSAPSSAINEDGVFGTSREGWHPDLPDACREPFIPLLWLKVHELLGRVPEGSTARFLEDGTLPGEARGLPPPSTGSQAERGDRHEYR